MMLTPDDIAQFAALGVPPGLLAAAGVCRVTPAEARGLGIRYRSEHLGGIAFPRVDPETGHRVGVRVRRDHPEIDRDGKPIAKYLSAYGDMPHLYFPPGAGPHLVDATVPVVMVEAEKSVLALTAAGRRGDRPLLVISLGGCDGWRGRVGKTIDAEGARVDVKGPLPDLARVNWQNRAVTLLFDANAATNDRVRAARTALARDLTDRGARVHIASLPVEEGVNGPDDYVGKYGDDPLFALLDAATTWRAASGPSNGTRDSQATKLVQLALLSGVELFHTPGGDPHARVTVVDHHEIHAIRGRRFRRWLGRLHFTTTRKAAGGQAVQDALNILEAHALFEGPKRPVFVRVAEHGKAVYLDLADDGWRVIEITAAGWRVITDSPVAFRRAPGMLPLPIPIAGGPIDALRPFVNVGTEDDWRLLVGCLVAALRPRGPYPVLVLQGEQGSAKTTAARVFRALVDPNAVAVRAEPRDGRDLMIAATNGWVIALDNLSHVQAWLSDALCRLSTGGGFSTRELYTDAEEVLFEAQRPVILNGIEELATRSDLLDRAVMLSSPVIPEHRRQSEEEFWEAFQAMRPFVLGAVLDAVVIALRRLPSVKLAKLPRMADLAKWVTAAEPALGWELGDFMVAYSRNREASNDMALEGSPVAAAVTGLVAEREEFSGTASELLATLEKAVEEKIQKQHSWPRSPRAFSNVLRRLAPNLRASGIDIGFRRDGRDRRRLITIRTTEASCARIVRSQKDSEVAVFGADDPRTHTAATQTQNPSLASAANTDLFGLADEADAADAATQALPDAEQSGWTEI